MNDEQLESLLEEAINSIQDHIPDMVQSLQQGTGPFLSALTHLDISNQLQTTLRPMLNILQDISNVNIVTENISGETMDVSLNSVEYNTNRFSNLFSDTTTNTNTNTNTINTNVNTTTTDGLYPNHEHIHNMALFNFALEYLDNMRLFQQNMNNLIRSLEPPRTRNRNRSNSRLFPRDRGNIPLLTSLPGRLSNDPSNQIAMEFVATPFSFLNNQEQAPVPTLQQFTNATELFTYNSQTLSRINSITCPITLEDFQHGDLLCEIKHCHHVFKESALRNWFVRNTHCPVCRYDIRNFAA